MSWLVQAQGLGKRYPVLGQRGDHLRALWDILRGRAPRRTVSVLEEIGFEVRRGESLAIIGENGAGKSTLLKLITGVLTPSSGSVRTQGRIGALLELGAGFHPEYSGRDNVRMAAALHGMSPAELAAKLPEIEAFADIGAYLDEPVKHYSSGMVVRLGFAVIVAVRPELLITDEVLAVGDESFQRKCIRWLDGYIASGGTLLLVSHSLYHVQKLCKQAVWLQHGRIREHGDVFDVTRHYQAWHEARLAAESAPLGVRGGGRYSVESVRINGLGDEQAVVVDVGAALEQEVILHARDGDAPVFLNGIVRNDGTPVYGISSEMAGVVPQALPDGRFRFRLRFPALALLPGRYTLRSHALDPQGLSLHDTVDRDFEVTGSAREYGLVRLQHEWLS